jgi:feruloyl esterase
VKPGFSRSLKILIASSTAFVLAACSGGSDGVSCESLAQTALPNTTITTAVKVPAGSFQPPSGAALESLPEFCRIAGRIQNHPTSRINFEVWLPTQAANYRFVQVGNGGFAGSIQYGAMATRLREGYAVANTDDGTSPAPGVSAAESGKFLGDMERLYDFKGRAVTLTAGVAKSLYSAFFQSPPAKSYFTGFSSGGLEALAVVQRIGDQFDGVSAGCPANNSAGLFTQAVWNYKYYQKVSTKLQLVHDAAVAACDSTGDGVKDGVIGDPERCNFDPAVLMCSGGDQANCLTAEQVDAVRKIYEGPVNPQTGTKTSEAYAPGMPRGSELVWPQSQGQALGASQPWYGMVLNNSLTFDLANFDFDQDVTRALTRTLPYGAQTTNPDISQFKNRGGKLLMWAGWNDPLWSQGNAVNYYKSTVANSGANGVQLFMAPGMGHCGGGDGANVVDTFPSLVTWVESGKVPERIPATKYVNNQQAQGVAFTRPLCPYPAIAKYKGSGDPNAEASFECVAPQ